MKKTNVTKTKNPVQPTKSQPATGKSAGGVNTPPKNAKPSKG